MPRLDVRTTEEIKEMLRYIAEHDNRSMSKEIEHLIKERYNKILKEKV